MSLPALSAAARRWTVIVAAAAVAVTGAVSVTAPAASAETVGTSTVLTAPVAAASADVPNSLRGQYRWMGYASQVASVAAPDVYYRDQTYWGRLEATKGVYDFKWIEDGLAKAAATKSKFGFRVMAYCPGCWMDARPDKATWPSVTPSWLPKQPGTAIPDWNSETFLSSWEALMAELGKRYGNDPRLGYVDVGGYGKYGEWWVDYPTTKITDANGLRLIAAVNKAFPTKHVLINTMTSVDFTLKALATNPLMGMRTDSLGATNMNSMLAVDSRLQGYWPTRPFFSEWATNGDPVLGRTQVGQFHVSTTSSENMRLKYAAMTDAQKTAYTAAMNTAGFRYAIPRVEVSPVVPGQPVTVKATITNTGSAPTYDPWSVRLVWSRPDGSVAAATALPVDLRKVLPGTSTPSVSVTAPNLPVGDYEVGVQVADPAGYLTPMTLANTGRDAAGAYPLGTVAVKDAATAALTIAQGTAGASTVPLTGTLTRAGAALPGVPVLVQRQDVGATAWTTFGTVTTTTAGTVSMTVPTAAPATYRFLYAGDPTTFAAASATTTVRAASAAAVTVAGTWPKKATVTVKAKATGKVIPGMPVTVKTRAVGSTAWSTIGTYKTNAYGQVAYATYPKTPRVVGFFAAGTTSYLPGSTSATLTVPTTLTTSVVKGRPNVVKAKLTTKAGTVLAGRTVYLQRRYYGSSTWSTITSAKTSSTGYVTSKQQPKRKTYYRWVFKGESGKYTGVTSASVYVSY